MTATQEFVVPKSTPITSALADFELHKSASSESSDTDNAICKETTTESNKGKIDTIKGVSIYYLNALAPASGQLLVGGDIPFGAFRSLETWICATTMGLIDYTTFTGVKKENETKKFPINLQNTDDSSASRQRKRNRVDRNKRRATTTTYLGQSGRDGVGQ